MGKELENPDVWNNPALAEALGKERSGLEAVTENIERVTNVLAESAELLELAEAEEDESTLAVVQADVSGIEADIEKLEFQRMFSGKADASNAFVDVQAGSGGTEAQGTRVRSCADVDSLGAIGVDVHRLI